MTDNPGLYIGGPDPQYLLLNRANRHGLITGATGTGKTVTLQVLAEGFSRAGVPVFAADIKGDLSGLSQPGSAKPFITERAAALGLKDFSFEAVPAVYWDIFGKAGHPLRSTISEMGPLLIARLLALTEAQEGVLNIAFKLADDEGLLLLDLKDLQALLVHVAEKADELTTRYGNVAKATVGAIQRSLLTLENQGGAQLFGEPALQLADFLRTDMTGRGIVNILAADQLFERPQLYATFLLWLLSELFEELPEVGDPDKPKLVFFFDEAHLLFDDAPKALLAKIAQVVRLIRSKGVGVYFVTQNPADVPGEVLAQLGNRVHHALRAFTPKEQKSVKVAADSLRPNPAFDTAEIIGTLGVGEALVSTLDAKGVPSIVERTLIAPPRSRAGAITPAERQTVMAASPLAGKYDQRVDRESAYERLTQRQAPAPAPGPVEAPRTVRAPAEPRPEPRPAPRSNRQSVGEAFAKSVVRTIGSSVGREIIRGVLGSILRR
jgi:DNA helicase HerA-like ATPase